VLGRSDPDPVLAHNAGASGPVLLTCEHAGQAVPSVLGDMGVSDQDWQRHIAWDVGALKVAERMSNLLDARLIAQRYSRLVIDCNRALISPDLMPEVSDGTSIPANSDLTDAARHDRISGIHQPYHHHIASEIERQRPALLISVHSFTPHMNGQNRPWHCGYLANRMPAAAEALAMMSVARAPYLNFAVNEPYTVDDISDYTLPVHGEVNAIPHALLEIRNDQLQGDVGIDFWADFLAGAIQTYLRSIENG